MWNESGIAGNGERSIWKGAIAGLAGGLVAAWTMNQFQTGLSAVAHAMPNRSGGRDTPSPPSEGGEDATVKTAAAISESLLDHPLTDQEKEAAGPAVHYAFGAAVGALYGALAETAPATSAGFGLPYAAAVWLGADEIAVPAFGLGKRPAEVPASTHLSALATHLVFGVTLDSVRRGVRAVW